MSERWYVVQSKSHHEVVAYDNLIRQKYDAYLPLIVHKREYRNGSVVKEILIPMFSSYLFVQFDIEKDKWRSILGTRGVQNLLGSTELYVAPLPIGFIEDLRKKEDSYGVITIKAADKVLSKYMPGDSVKVVGGLYSGLSGTCAKVNQDFATLILSLQAGEFTLNLPLELIEST